MGMSQAQLDAYAQSIGYPSYAAWLAQQRQKDMASQQKQQMRRAAPSPKKSNNFLQSLISNMHPGFGLIQNSSEKYRKAQEGTRR